MEHHRRILEKNALHLVYSWVPMSGFSDVERHDSSTQSDDLKNKVMSAWDGVVESNRNLIKLLRSTQTRTLAATTFARLYAPLSRQRISSALINALFTETTFRNPTTIQYLWYEMSRAKDVLDQLALLHVLEILCGYVESPMGFMNQIAIKWKWRTFFEPALRFCMSIPSFSSPFLDQLFQDLLDVAEKTPDRFSYIFPSITTSPASFRRILESHRYQAQPPSTEQRTSTTYSLANCAMKTLHDPFFHYRIQLSLESTYNTCNHLQEDGRDMWTLGLRKALVKTVADAMARRLVSLLDRGHCDVGQVMQVCEEHPDLERPVRELVRLSAGRYPVLDAALLHGDDSHLLHRSLRCTGIVRLDCTKGEPGLSECLVTDSQNLLCWLEVAGMESRSYDEYCQPLPIFHPSPVYGQGPFCALRNNHCAYWNFMNPRIVRSLTDNGLNLPIRSFCQLDVTRVISTWMEGIFGNRVTGELV
ncbi:hypothetical protein JAAARDRAFT_80704, partial [Jaapia argillacea MUCL 33604]